MCGRRPRYRPGSGPGQHSQPDRVGSEAGRGRGARGADFLPGARARGRGGAPRRAPAASPRGRPSGRGGEGRRGARPAAHTRIVLSAQGSRPFTHGGSGRARSCRNCSTPPRLAQAPPGAAERAGAGPGRHHDASRLFRGPARVPRAGHRCARRPTRAESLGAQQCTRCWGAVRVLSPPSCPSIGRRIRWINWRWKSLVKFVGTTAARVC